ncbi:leucine-rich repeat domain-containing protein [Moorena sp. SIO3H5]|uniref:leucine-rich repeat domain-containing protein n=1 Tax=Moorena sp. SIO3H5 TaxID=2607834 RepID=UPI0013BD6DC8|nr:leucine-rich repeat domain-containing protein [Moorena sp. SIO3H5]NEO69504.1 leucine-rich repeat domain-containing protein [Moorena sp. SIO3H5]
MSEDSIPARLLKTIQEVWEENSQILNLSNLEDNLIIKLLVNLLLNETNEISNIIEIFLKFDKIKQLNLMCNNIYKIPESFTDNFYNLTHLYLYGNRLRYLPESIGDFSTLIHLDLSYNRLRYLPESIGNISTLIHLNLSGNQLSNLPESLGNLSKLKFLCLTGNQINYLPKSLGNLSNLEYLYLWNNPLICPPPEVAHRGVDAIIQYFRQLTEEGLYSIIEYKQEKSQCQENNQMVTDPSLADDRIDVKHLISTEQQDINQSIKFEGTIQNSSLIIVQQGNNSSNFNEPMGNINDQSRHINISDNATVTNSGDGLFNLGDISGKVANTINQLPSFDPEPDKKQLKELLSKLHNAVIEEDLDETDKAEALEQIEDIASSLTNSEDSAVKKIANKAMKMLSKIADNLPRGAAIVTICKELPALISKIF